MNDWIAALSELTDDGVPSVLVTVARVRGSAPREVGAKMIVTAGDSIGTIGGGQLEYQCIRLACELLQSAARKETTVRKFSLGAGCGQCCGGVVDMLFEPVPAAGWMRTLCQLHGAGKAFVIGTRMSAEGSKFFMQDDDPGERTTDRPWPPAVALAGRDLLANGSGAACVADILLEPVRRTQFHIAVFGAGHVGAATIDALSRLDCYIRWIDSRRNLFPRKLPRNVLAIETAEPASEVAAMPAGSYYLVMTHSHPLDLQICEQILGRGDPAYTGLIGSASKRRKFERLLKQSGHSPDLLRSLRCPIGLPGLHGKKPAEIALSVAAEILQLRQASLQRSDAPAVVRQTRVQR